VRIGELGVDTIISAEAASSWAAAHPRLASLAAVAHRSTTSAVFVRSLGIHAGAIAECFLRIAFALAKNATFARRASRITLAAMRCTLAHVHTRASAKKLTAWALAGSAVADSSGAAGVATSTTIGTIARQHQAHAPAVTLTTRAGLSTLPVSAAQGSAAHLPAAAAIGCIILRVRAAPGARELTRCTARGGNGSDANGIRCVARRRHPCAAMHLNFSCTPQAPQPKEDDQERPTHQCP